MIIISLQSLLDVDQHLQKIAPTLIPLGLLQLELAVPQSANATQTFVNLGWISINSPSLALPQ